MKQNKSVMSVQTLTLGAVLTALVVLLQLMGSFIRFGTFSISLVLVPIVIGAATCGVLVGGWLGLVFGIAVLLSGDAAVFLGIHAIGTVITVLLKGLLAGLAAGFVYKLLEKYNRYAAVVAAAIACPIVNTGVFLLGCLVFFLDTIKSWAGGDGLGYYMIVILVGGNFLFELLFNIVLSPIVVRLLDIWKKPAKSNVKVHVTTDVRVTVETPDSTVETETSTDTTVGE